MNAAGFLALTEKRPLPWAHQTTKFYGVLGNLEAVGSGYVDANGKTILEAPAVTLMHAAPAMAAAILRMLACGSELTDDGWIHSADFDDAWEALRASLPDSLRP